VSTYRSLVVNRHGAPLEAIEVGELERLPLADGEIRLACEAVGLNFLDVTMIAGNYPNAPLPPFTPGVEVAGRVIEAGRGAERMLGLDVVSCPALPRGALGDEVVIAASLAVERRSTVDAVTAAALPVTYQTSWWGLERGHVTAGQTILVNAGAGGVGTATIQLAVARGVTVIATAGGPAKTALCLAQGASVAIDYLAEDVLAAVREATGGRGVDAVVDPVGGAMTEISLACLRFEGHLIAIGAAGGPSTIDPTRLMGANVTVVGLSWGSTYPFLKQAEVADVYAGLFDLVETGGVRPVIDRVIGLDETAAALDDLASRRTTGKIIVKI
jgi:NADPH2:quinone reductase